MYKDTVTLFNRKQGANGDTWYPAVLEGVNLNKDKGAIFRRYGPNSTDNAVLNVRYEKSGEDITVNRKTWLQPKEWARLEEPSGAITFAPGDFFYAGTWEGTTPLYDGAYGDLSFYDYMLNNYDDVFLITSVGFFSVIPHMEVTAR